MFSGTKLADCVPEFQPAASLVPSITESIAWMDQHNLVPETHDDDLQDRIITLMRDLPFQIGE